MEERKAAPNIFFKLDVQGHITYISPIVQSILGYDLALLLNIYPIPFISDHNVFLEATKSCKEVLELNLLVKKADGNFINCTAQGFNSIKEGTSCGSTWVMKEDHSEPDDIINIDFVMCQVCERAVPAVVFAQHSKICIEIHGQEMEIALTKDELKSIKASLEEKSSMLMEEYQLELVENESDGDYLVYIDTLNQVSHHLLEFIDESTATPIPRWDDNVDHTADLSPVLDPLSTWIPPTERELFPEITEHFEDSEAIEEIAGDIFNFALQIESLAKKLVLYIQELKPNIIAYRQVSMDENMVKVKIGMQLANEVDAFDDIRVQAPSGEIFDESANASTSASGYASPRLSTTEYPKTAFDETDELRIEKQLAEAKGRLLSINTNFLKDKELMLGKVVEPMGDTLSHPKARRGSRVPRMVLGAHNSVDISGAFMPPSPHRALSQSSFSPSSPTPGSPGSFSSSIQEQRVLPSMKDYIVMKPISKGAFGSVFLAKKKITGEYYAIKVLKKADMVSKKQVMNVKSERTILTQLDSPYIVKLFNTFQSSENIYLVMEYLNGGDCASLLKNMGQLDEKWARQYVAEMVLGLEFLHERGIVHRYASINV